MSQPPDRIQKSFKGGQGLWPLPAYYLQPLVYFMLKINLSRITFLCYIWIYLTKRGLMANAAKIIRTSCRGCHGVCQVVVHLDANGVVTGITGDKNSPTSNGYICPKGAKAAETLYHPARLTRPLRRLKGRGEGVWEPIAWEAAIDLIVTNFDRIRRESGPEYIAVAQGTGRPYTEFTGLFANALGTPNHVSPGHNCFVPRNICAGLTLGWFPQPDIYGRGGSMPRCLMILGSNTIETGAADGYAGKMVNTAFRNAEKTIVIDPRAITAARKSDFHLALRPGTECALVLAMLHTIIRENAYDSDFVERYCAGFEELKEHLRPFSPTWAAKICRVPAALIEGAALTFAQTRPAALVWGNGVDESICAFQTARAVYILLAVCGTLDVPGGMVRWVPPADIRNKSGMVDPAVQGGRFLSPEQRKKVISPFPFCPGAHAPSFWKACVTGVPYKPRAIWLMGTNPVVTQTRGDITRDALRDHLEFSVCSEFFMTPTAALTDLVLPAQHWLEQDDVVFFHKIWCVLARKKIAQVGETREDRGVILEVARKLGLEEAFPWPDWRAYLEWLVEPSGLSFDEFAQKGIVLGEMSYRKYERDGFHTPSGKVELLSSVMERMGLPALPLYTEPPLSPVSTPELTSEFPFIFITGCKVLPFFHSEGRNVPSLRATHPVPLAEMHPEAAAACGLLDGQAVNVSTPYGTQRFTLRLDDRLQPDVVHAEHAWWFPEQAGPNYGAFTSNVNLLFSHEHFDPLSGAEPLKSYLCNVTAAH
jgi:anaerobic selenocysteine-containing dehydrogenase